MSGALGENAASPLEEMRAGFQTEDGPPRLYKRLPGGDGKSVAEYQVLDNDAVEEALESDVKLHQDSDLLIRALVAIHRHDPDNPKADKRGLVELGAWAGQDFGGPVKFDKRLADAIGIPDQTAREICLRMFKGNQIALGAQAAMVTAWMTDTSEQALQDFTEGSSTPR